MCLIFFFNRRQFQPPFFSVLPKCACNIYWRYCETIYFGHLLQALFTALFHHESLETDGATKIRNVITMVWKIIELYISTDNTFEYMN